MDLFKIIAALEQADPEAYGRFDTRRRVFRHFSGFGKQLTAAALPAFVGALFNKAYGQGNPLLPGVGDVLNLALQLEYLEYHFYNTALNAGSLLNAADRAAIITIRNDESGHIKTLRAALGTQAFSATDPTAAAFDYTAGGRFPNVFTAASEFYAVAQSFVDTGVRAYKGGSPKLMGRKDLLDAALRIHSVEARHASHIRTIRRGLSTGVHGAAAAQVPGSLTDLSQKPKSWISGTDNGGAAPPFTTPIYAAGNPATGTAGQIFFPSESQLLQAGLNTETRATPPAGLTITAAAASEAFDEALDDAQVKTIARFFRSATGASAGLFQ